MPAHKYQTTKGIMWYASINYIDPVTKKSARKVKRGFATKREAKDYETDFLAQIKKEGFDSSINPKAPFLEVYKAYQRHITCKELREDTIETKTSIINHYILPFFGKYTIGEVDENVLTDWKNYMLACTTKQGTPLSDIYLRSIQNQLDAILNYAVKKGYIAVSPMIDLKHLGSKYAEEYEIWTPEEFEKFAFAAMERPRTYLIFELLFWLGLRRGEALALSFGSVVFEDDGFSYIKVRKSRNARGRLGEVKTTESYRILYLPDFLEEELREYVSTLYDPQPSDLLFNVSTKTLYSDFNAACKAAGVKRIRPHDMRHSFASLIDRTNKFSTTDLSKALGHSSSSTTMRTYLHSCSSAKRAMAKVLDDIKKGG